jgi:hypothetical protein
VLTGALLFLLVVVLLLAVPLTINFYLHWNQGLSGHVQLGWANGHLHTEIPIQPGARKAKSKPKRKDKQRSSKPSGISGKTLLRNKPFRDRVMGYIRETWKAIEKRELKLLARIGLDDPADTGMLWSVLGPLGAILATSRNSEISLQPDFLDPVFELQSSGRIRIIPLQLLYLTTRLLLSPTIWLGIHRARKRPN